MSANAHWTTILIADDSAEDRNLMKRAFEEAGVSNRLDFVRDGHEVLSFLKRPEASAGDPPRIPGLILLDLNMPRMDGRETLKLMRSDPELAFIPVIVLSTSNAREDVLGSYRLGANAVMVKPMGYHEFVDLVSMVCRYWLEHVQLPVQFKL